MWNKETKQIEFIIGELFELPESAAQISDGEQRVETSESRENV
jgi:hypothetical protein